MIRPVEVKALEPFKIRIRFSDQKKGSVDLSYLADHGVFKAWNYR